MRRFCVFTTFTLMIAVITSCKSDSGTAEDILGKDLYLQLLDEYEFLDDFNEGLLLVCDEDVLAFGYYDKRGEAVIPLQYEAADGFREGKALTVDVRNDECVFEYIDTKGRVIDVIDYDTYICEYEDVEDIFYQAYKILKKNLPEL